MRGAVRGVSTQETVRILLTAADPRVRQALVAYLAYEGYAARTAADCNECWRVFGEWSPDLVVCDHRPPELDALELCRCLRAVSSVPILLTAAGHNGPLNADALNAGADYCLRPVDPDEVLASVRALLRRVPGDHRAACAPLEVGDFHVVEATRRCVVRDRALHLTTKEFTLLLHLLRSPKSTFSHQELLRAVWGEEHAGEPEFLRPLILQLRKKIEPDWRHPIYILTEYKIGYRFNPGIAETSIPDAPQPQVKLPL